MVPTEHCLSAFLEAPPSRRTPYLSSFISLISLYAIFIAGLPVSTWRKQSFTSTHDINITYIIPGPEAEQGENQTSHA
ncbi:hypothetical protein PISMIDRAFT_681610 [Pisolithus microcarpus 441]|uniref:Uncharacterized protein n=1 Tax=Pisolithus microcarpus 441 TaxID=765257 RepID=A0A0C9ZN24_9AGAM|nr:hypothetical protein BKA83DRAFT_681610 [Pisolithus microcarpus]KIK21218.1 hypothetical protein PISMIDRAFT_681610 [Pisolithus microcarpus 441]